MLFVLVCTLKPARAQELGFIHHSIEDGLAQSQVRAIEQDHRGYIWFATMGGVSRFDGVSFTNFSTGQGLLDNQVNCIYNAQNQDIWFGCSGGLSRFDGTQFFSYPFDLHSESYMVLDVLELLPGEFLVATNGNGLFRFYEKSGKYEQVSSYADDALIRRLIKTNTGDILVCSRSGLDRIVGLDLSQKEPILANLSVSDVVVTPSNDIWVSTFGNGIFKLSEDTIINLTETEGLQSDHVREITIDPTGHIWVASRFGLNKISPQGKPTLNTNSGLNYDNIKTLFIDREENLWIGTDGKGVYRFTGERFITYSKKDGLVSDIVMAVQKDNQNRVWLGTYDNGACVFTPDTTTMLGLEEGLLHNTIWSIDIDHLGRVWLGTNAGVSKYEDGRFSNYSTSGSGDYMDRVTAIHEDRKNRIWFGVVSGIARFENGDFVDDPMLDNFPGTRVRSIYEADNGDMWFGAENGLVHHTANGYKTYLIPSGLKNSVVYNVVQDHSGRLWVGTKGGLFTFENDTLVPVVFSDGFGSNSINFLQPDENRFLYIGTNNGLFVLDAEMYNNQGIIRTEHFTDQEGLPSLECNQNAVYLDKSGTLWFGTTEGLIRHKPDPTLFNADRHQPKTHISNVKLILKEQNWDEYADSVDHRSGLPIGLELQPTNNHLTFEYVGLFYSNPGKVVYQYMLEGVDEHWLPETHTKSATYASLPHGSFTFKVRSRTDGGIWGNEIASFKFTILPPFYLTWWFIVLAVLLGLLIVASFIFALLQREARKRKTQQLVYTSRMLALEQQTLNSSMNRHFVFNALNSIQFYINRQDKLLANKYLSSFAKLIRKNLDSSQTNFTTLADEIERIELYLSLEGMRFPDKFSYQIKVDPSIDTHAVQIPAMLFQPYLENSIWHGILPTKKAGHISIDVSRKQSDVEIKITDNGIGIEASRKQRKNGDDSHISQGMQINQNRIELFRKMTGQNFQIDGPHDLGSSKNGQHGTVVAITFPVESSIEKTAAT